MISRMLRLTMPVMLLLAAATSGCVQDRVAHHYTYQRPIYQTLAQVHANMKSGPGKEIAVPGKIALYKNYLLISEGAGGIHVFNNKDPKNPVNEAFIPLFGNSDIAISNDVLYADDGYSELIAFDISNPADIKITSVLPRMFYFGADTSSSNPAYNSYSESTPVISGYVTVDTTVYGNYESANGNCSNCNVLTDLSPASSYSGAAGNTVGTTGSTARFAIHNNYLYALNGQAYLDVFDISQAKTPVVKAISPLDGYYETLFSLNDHLFMGATLGMFIYDASDPLNVVKSGSFSHVQSCDPVIADGDYAFVTAWEGSACGGGTNELDVLDVRDLRNPVPLEHYSLPNPRGMAKDGDLLLICDGRNGLGSYRITNGSKVTPLSSGEAMEANDVIASGGLAVVTTPKGIFQYSYDATTGKLEQLSKIYLGEKY